MLFQHLRRIFFTTYSLIIAWNRTSLLYVTLTSDFRSNKVEASWVITPKKRLEKSQNAEVRLDQAIKHIAEEAVDSFHSCSHQPFDHDFYDSCLTHICLV